MHALCATAADVDGEIVVVGGIHLPCRSDLLGLVERVRLLRRELRLSEDGEEDSREDGDDRDDDQEFD